jgi:hypothetical protein
VSVFFARCGVRIWVEPEVHEIDADVVGLGRAAMEILVSGEAHNPDLQTLVPPGTRVLGANVRDRVLIVDLSGDIRDRGGASSEEGAFGQQLAHTAAAFSNIDAVQLYVEGQPITDLWGHFDWSQPLEPDEVSLSPIVIDEPRYGGTVEAGAVVASGEATVFEAEFLIRLYGPDGSLISEDWVMATTGGPDRGTWEHTFEITTPGRYTIEAEEQDAAGGQEGRPPFGTRGVFDVEG